MFTLQCESNSVRRYPARRYRIKTVVGLCLARSLDMIVGLIGILKAGGAYLPLDPDYPTERLAFMLADARARVLLTHGPTRGPTHGATHAVTQEAIHEAIHGALMEGLPAQAHATVVPRIVDLDADAAAIAAEPATAPAVALDAQHPAYVIYTSGSTGTPKGVVVNHAGLPNSSRPPRTTLRSDPLDAPCSSPRPSTLRSSGIAAVLAGSSSCHRDSDLTRPRDS